MKKSHVFCFVGGAALALLCVYFFQSSLAKSTSPAPEVAAKECPPDPTAQALAAPTFHESMPAILTSGTDGALKIRWNPVEYAKSYVVRIYTPDGKAIRKWKSDFALIGVKDLPFNEKQETTPYFVTLSSVNRLGNPGSESAKREVRVLRRRNIVAPEIDSITVEE